MITPLCLITYNSNLQQKDGKTRNKRGKTKIIDFIY